MKFTLILLVMNMMCQKIFELIPFSYDIAGPAILHVGGGLTPGDGRAEGHAVTSQSQTLNPTPYTLHPTPYTLHSKPYRGTSLIRDSAPLGPYSRTMPRAFVRGGLTPGDGRA